tara:strand:- start:1475 stop:2296 length:822 start_codon:yes stop_codon:yes gene_type:complete
MILFFNFYVVLNAKEKKVLKTKEKTQIVKIKRKNRQREAHNEYVKKGAHGDWNYTNKGPSTWANRDPAYKLCSHGKQQSPINIITKESQTFSSLDYLSVNFRNESFSVINNGHTVQFNAKNSTSNILGDEYRLLQFHFHTPSENRIDGKPSPLEAHFVHENSGHHLAVISVLFDISKTDNPLLQPILDFQKEGQTVEKKGHDIDPSKFLSNWTKYIYFHGSLTTPPCSQGVLWLVMKEKSTLSSSQLKKFLEIMGENNRPVLDVDKRPLMKNF